MAQEAKGRLALQGDTKVCTAQTNQEFLFSDLAVHSAALGSEIPESA